MSTKEQLKKVIEDHALEQVPMEERKSFLSLSWNTMGICSTLIQLLIGGVVTFIAGMYVGFLAALVSVILGTTLGWLVGYISFKRGLSSTVIARFHGFGTIGSGLIASSIYSFMIIGFLALENALLYEGILFYLDLQHSITNAILIYGILTLAWIFLAMWGIKWITHFSSSTIIAFLLVLAYMLITCTSKSGMGIGEILSHAPVFPGGTKLGHFFVAINMLMGSVGALALVDADYGRYARSGKDVFLMALLGFIMMDILMFTIGAVIIYAGFDTVKNYYVANGMAMEQAANLALNNVAATFIILGGLVGTILMLLAQAKAQVLNTYSASLALSNFFDTLKIRQSRFLTVIIANIIGILMVVGNILGLVQSWLTVLGVITTCFAVIIVADFYFVRKKQTQQSENAVENFNWAGIITVTVASVLAMALQKNVPIPFLTSTVISLVIYPFLRIYVLKPDLRGE